MPLAIVEHSEAARRRRRATGDMDDNVNAAELADHGIRDRHAARGGGDVCSHKQFLWRKIVGPRPRGGEESRARFAQPRRHGLADTLGAARDERTLATELENTVHQRTSSAPMRPSPTKPNR